MLQLDSINFAYGNNRVLDNFTYHFQEKTIYALMGANGSGKTTLFNVIGGYLHADGGNITFSGNNINGFKPHKVARLGITRTFQDMRLIPSISVWDNLLLAIPNKPSEKLPYAFLSSKDSSYQERIGKILKYTHLEDVKGSKAADISYGQQKLLNLAVAIAKNFDLLLLDEPIAGVQPEFREEILALIKSFQKTVIVIEHNPEFIERLTDSVLFLDDGQIIAQGSYSDIKANKRVQEAYL